MSDNEQNEVSCRLCNQVFKNKKGLSIHMARCQGSDKTRCPHCGNTFFDTRNLNRHIVICKSNSIDDKEKKRQDMCKEKDKQLKEAKNQEKLLKEEIASLKFQTDELKRELKEAAKKYEDSLKETIKHLFQKQSVTHITHNTNNQVSQNLNINLKPVDSNNLKTIIQDLLLNDTITNEQNFARQIFNKGLKDKVMLVDTSRGIVTWIDENNQSIRDKRAVALSTKVYDVGYELFAERKEELESSLFSPSLMEEAACEVENQVNFCARIVNKSSNSMKEFGKEIATLALDKTAIHMAIQGEVDPFLFLVEMLMEDLVKAGYKGFIGDANNFGRYCGEVWKKVVTLPNYGEEQLIQVVHPETGNKTLSHESFKNVVRKALDNIPNIVCKLHRQVVAFANKDNLLLSFDQVEIVYNTIMDDNNTEWEELYFGLLN